VIYSRPVTEPCTVVIGASDFLPGLKERATAVLRAGELLAFSDAESLRALETITRRRPAVVALERLFAVTPRGVALINRIKADPSLRQSEIRVIEHNSDYARVVPRPAATPEPSLDQRGTRRAERVKIADRVKVLVAAKLATLVDLSSVGAQVITSEGMKPNQRVDVALIDSAARITFSATVVWTAFQMSDGEPTFRAGLDFVDADGAAVVAYAQRHKRA
jgi:PilZ domain-containing protein